MKERSFNKSKIGTNSIILIFCKAISAISSMIVSAIITYNFAKEQAGTYSQALLVSSFAQTISLLSLTDAINFFYNKNSEVNSQTKYCSTILTMQFISSTLFAIAIASLCYPISCYFKNQNLTYALLIICFYPLISNFIAIFQILLISQKKAIISSVSLILVSIVNLALVSIATYVLNNIYWTLGFVVISHAIELIFMGLVLRKTGIVFSFKLIDKKAFKDILSFVLPLFVYSFINSINMYSDKFIIALFANVEEQAVYNFAAKILPFNIITASFVSIMAPNITKYYCSGDYCGVAKIYKNYLYLGLLSTAVLCLGTILNGKDFMNILYGSTYESGAPIFIFYTLSEIFVLLNFSLVLRSANKTKWIMCVGVIAVVLNIALDFVFYYIFGLFGPAVATFLVSGIVNISFFILAIKVLKVKLSEIIYTKKTVIALIEMIISFLAFYLLKIYIIQPLKLNSFLNVLCLYMPYVLINVLINIKNIFRCIQEMNNLK